MLSPGEIVKNMNITVLEWEPVVHEPDGVFTMTKVVHQDNSWKGKLLIVVNVQLPYVYVIEYDGWSKKPFSIDTRRAKLMELKPEIVEAIKGK